jgi:hypothetical protein
MPFVEEPPSKWLDKAEEARAVAEQLSDRQARDRMLKIAEAYDHLAQFAEKQRITYAKLRS